MTAEQFYYFACGAVLVLTLVIFWVAVIMPAKNQWEKRFFIAWFAMFVLSMITISVDLMTYTDSSLATVAKINQYFEYLFVSITMPMFTAYLLHTCGEDWRKSLLFRVACIFLGNIFYFAWNFAVYNIFVLYHA